MATNGRNAQGKRDFGGVAMWAGGKKVVDVTFTKFRWNPKATSETFDL